MSVDQIVPVTVKPAAAGNPWRPSFWGIKQTAIIELRRRKPAPAVAYILLGILVLGSLAALIFGSKTSNYSPGDLELILALALTAALLVAPSVTATAINGDSLEGLLAPLQMTRLTAGDLAIGKVVGSWVWTLVLISPTAPLIIFTFLRSGWSWQHLAASVAAILAMIFVAAAFGLMWSALTARTPAAIALTHLTTVALAFGTLILYASATMFTSEWVTVTVREPNWDHITMEEWEAVEEGAPEPAPICEASEQQWEVRHTEKVWWLMLPNPYLILAEQAKPYDREFSQQHNVWQTTFQNFQDVFSEAQQPPALEVDFCKYYEDDYQESSSVDDQRRPWEGLAVLAVFALGAITVAIRRLRVPYRKLRGGTRVA